MRNNSSNHLLLQTMQLSSMQKTPPPPQPPTNIQTIPSNAIAAPIQMPDGGQHRTMMSTAGLLNALSQSDITQGGEGRAAND